MRKVFTLAIIVKDGKVLLGKKQRKLGAGLWNGFGGGVDPGETIEKAAIRECQEEAGITPTTMKKSGTVVFVHEGTPLGAREHEVHIFTVKEFTGTPAATSEMSELTWFAVTSLPYTSMWRSDQYWLPLLLEGKEFSGRITFNAAMEVRDWVVKEQQIPIVQT